MLPGYYSSFHRHQTWSYPCVQTQVHQNFFQWPWESLDKPLAAATKPQLVAIRRSPPAQATAAALLLCGCPPNSLRGAGHGAKP